MKLPDDTIIARVKLTSYLLTEQLRGDKSRFLAEAGYIVTNPERLEQDLREQILTLDAILLPSRGYGDYYQISGSLCGPSGVALNVRTIWMREWATGLFKFITLIPLTR